MLTLTTAPFVSNVPGNRLFCPENKEVRISYVSPELAVFIGSQPLPPKSSGNIYAWVLPHPSFIRSAVFATPDEDQVDLSDIYMLLAAQPSPNYDVGQLSGHHTSEFLIGRNTCLQLYPHRPNCGEVAGWGLSVRPLREPGEDCAQISMGNVFAYFPRLANLQERQHYMRPLSSTGGDCGVNF